MVRKHAFLALILATSLTGSASAALASGGPVTRPAPKAPIVRTLSPQVNGPIGALYFLGDRLLGAVKVLIGVGTVKGPTDGTVFETHGIEDSPDTTGPIGIKGSRLPVGDQPPNP